MAELWPSGFGCTKKLHTYINTLAGGHYTISLHNKEAGNILMLDDSKMYTKVLDEEEKSSMPYMFVYVQM